MSGGGSFFDRPVGGVVPREPAQLEAVYRLVSAVHRAAELPEVHEAALDALQRVLNADRASILLFDADGVMRFKAWRGLSERYRRAVEGHSPWRPDARDPRPILVSDVLNDAALTPHRETILGEGIRALGFVPLCTGGRLLGKFMVYFDAPRTLSQDELQVAEIVAGHVAFAVGRNRAEHGLRLYREIFAHSTEGIVAFDTDGRYLEQNAAHEALIGYGDAELAGRTPALYLGDDAFEALMRDLAQSGSVSRELRARRRDGETLELELSAFAVRDEAGRPACYVGLGRDIARRKRSERALRLLAQASAQLDASLDYATTLATVAHVGTLGLADWCLVDVLNGPGGRALEAAHAQPERQPQVLELRDRCRAALPHLPEPIAEARLGQEALDELLALYGGDAERLQLVRRLGTSSAITVPLLARGRLLGLCCFVGAPAGRIFEERDLDVARNLAARAALALDNAELYQHAQDSDRRKDEFLAMLAHELRNPLAPILTSVQLMQRRQADPQTLERTLDIIGRQVRHMTRLIDDLLDVSRLTRGKIELRREPVELAEVVARATETIRPLLDKLRHALVVAVAPRLWVHADPVRLEQVVGNLLANAAKYTEPGGRIEVSAESEERDLVLRVADTGIGIAPSMLPRIFDLFMQGHRSLDRQQGGLGIGLTLVRSLVEMHGGSVTAASDGPALGSVFTVRLPRIEPPTRAAWTPAAGAANAIPSKRRILVVDDNADAASTLADALLACGHDVRTALNGPEALAIAVDFEPHLVLLDIGLPTMDGYSVARRLREEPSLKTTVLVAVSGYGQDGDRRRSRNAGFEDHLVKPVELDAILRLLPSTASHGRE